MNLRTCHACTRFTGTKRRRSTGQQPGTKIASRSASKARMNHGQTAFQPLILFLHSVYIGCRLFVPLGRHSGNISRFFGGYERGLFAGRNVLPASNPDRPRTIPPCAWLRLARGMFGFWIRQIIFFRACAIILLYIDANFDIIVIAFVRNRRVKIAHAFCYLSLLDFSLNTFYHIIFSFYKKTFNVVNKLIELIWFKLLEIKCVRKKYFHIND